MLPLDAIKSPAFDFVRHVMYDFFKQDPAFPTIDQYNHFLQQANKKIISVNGHLIHAFPQTQSAALHDNYEASIYLRGELRTRENNWHDFFNLLMWHTFPKTKAVINKWQYLKLMQRSPTKPRSHIENLLTQLDEGGLLVLSSNKNLLHLMMTYQWKNLFWNHRHVLESEMQFCLIGHAIYEKILNPWIGISCPALMFEVDKSFFKKTMTEKEIDIDALCAAFLDNDTWHQPLSKLRSTPILGIPGWYQENNSDVFYDNQTYFWPGAKEVY